MELFDIESRKREKEKKLESFRDLFQKFIENDENFQDGIRSFELSVVDIICDKVNQFLK